MIGDYLFYKVGEKYIGASALPDISMLNPAGTLPMTTPIVGSVSVATCATLGRSSAEHYWQDGQHARRQHRQCASHKGKEQCRQHQSPANQSKAVPAQERGTE